MAIDRELWAGTRVLITGHTGFKGASLALMLQRLGAQVSGLSCGRPSSPSLYEVARVGQGIAHQRETDIRDAAAVRDALASLRPEVVFHLAAQPLVRRSLSHPLATYEVNVIGTANVLDAARLARGVRAIVVVTSDKCYANDGASRAFVEGDPLGGDDPYSSSKACAELVAHAYARSFFSAPSEPRIATARAGNVIGGGDWGRDRLLPDAVRVATGLAPAPLLVRNPHAVRPWQHVLNPLYGYLLLAQALLRGDEAVGAWNFGPPPADARPVRAVLQRLAQLWDGAPEWTLDGSPNPPEATRLQLDSTRARTRLGWSPPWDLDTGLAQLVRW
ncbi:MAG: CDP-glucose 4,6-dehydratase, partial [Solirubrobacteraceae bacterium]